MRTTDRPTEAELKNPASPSRLVASLLMAAVIATAPLAASAAPAAPAPAASPAVRPASATAAPPPVLAKAPAPPVIDGVLDDPAWDSGLRYDGFKTFKPDYGKEASQKTEAWISYDAENFYFAFRCYDSDPSKVKAAMSKRDNIFQDDVVFIVLDTFDDAQSGFSFILNPLGIQGDGMVDVNGNLSTSFDAVWYSKGRIDDQGWSVEARVPLQSIRFPGKKELTWRILFIRFFTRTSEQVAFPPIDPNYGSLMGQAQSFQVSGLRHQRVAELIPAATSSIRYERQGEEMARTERTPLKEVPSLTGKLGITSGLTLDAAYNPDFSQVEADAGQIDFNQRYSLYYEEKRPFFLEGSDLWQFGGSFEEAPLQAVVYTRTIVNPDYGFRLTGKIAKRDTIATIYAHDYLPGDEVDVHPDFAIARYKHALKDDAYIGGFFTDRQASGSYNRLAGADGRFRLSQTQVASFHLFGSFTKVPGGETVDAGHALGLDWNFSNRKWVVDVGYQDISENFQVDTGFVLRTGLRRLSTFAMYSIYPKSKFFQKLEPFYWAYQLYDTVYDMWESVNLFTFRMRLPRNTMIRFDTLVGNEVYLGQSFGLGGFGVQAETQLSKQLYLRGFVRRTGSTFYDPDTPYQGDGTRFMGVLDYQPMDQLDLALTATYIDFFRRSDGAKIYDYLILRSRNTFQLNKYLFVRGIVEYNDFYKRMTLDGLISFTYIPGTVVHVGYGSALEKQEWDEGLPGFVPSQRFHEMERGFFFKVSYLYRF
jgi:hypothetical protein